MSLVTRGLGRRNLLVTGGLGPGLSTAILFCPVDQGTELEEILQSSGLFEGDVTTLITDDQEVTAIEVVFNPEAVEVSQIVDYTDRYYSITGQDANVSILEGPFEQIVETVNNMQTVDHNNGVISIFVVPITEQIDIQELIDKVSTE